MIQRHEGPNIGFCRVNPNISVAFLSKTAFRTEYLLSQNCYCPERGKLSRIRTNNMVELAAPILAISTDPVRLHLAKLVF